MLKSKKLEKRWLKALRSGEYVQTKEVLAEDKTVDGKTVTVGWCCLGVLKNEYCKMNGLGWDDVNKRSTYELQRKMRDTLGISLEQTNTLMGM